ncbi:phosphate ABC transporter substrate-binding protein PstS [Mycobacterium sp. CVI_P3]|uniref:Phosphate-binding protein n=1 Tax=Mycobacterium pinniadriaticum TaxID=2994102 RepID=A0ABT3SMM8_9MYCO|nr:phosphate ABC transporter substrate-binding protein PstS [Mycobacterium pinniadriaticum]MCX2933981.1 phosphate ABC transporter substrate-binding protein PstS [Mycobacterium pinniadriaticum]MCX2940423.1 phosphate ABC transporter substrate-binding protein PstS [Mycobacterium pinniadriaticum]
MRNNSFRLALCLTAALAVPLSACGSDNAQPEYVSSAHIDCGGKKSLTASGSTAQANAIPVFVEAFTAACPGQTVNYTSNGSGAGVSEFMDNRTDFGGSDSALSQQRGEYEAAQRRCGSPAWNIPVVFGPIAITYNLSEVPTLVLDGPTSARIFNGAVTRWDDPAIKALNPTAQLPPTDIVVVYRSDESGTTDNFQRYLDAASKGAWGRAAGKTFNGGVGQGAKGNEGTSATVRDTPGAITYNEYSFAKAQRLASAQIVTSAGPNPVPITAGTVGKTISAATIIGQGNDLVLDTSRFYTPTAAGAYPIVLATYELVCSKYADSATGQAVRAFLQSAVGPGQLHLEDHGYFALPPDFQAKVAAAANAIS